MTTMTILIKKLPIGIQTFGELIEEGYLYVDKTVHDKVRIVLI